MARRRMFSKDVINSARFLKLPPMARLLYYDLGMAADDDGFVEAYTVMITTGAEEQDLKTLEERGFVSVLNADMVSHITDWKRNNLIKKDRYTPSIYSGLIPDGIGTQMEPEWNPNGTQMEPQGSLVEGSPVKSSLSQGREVELSGAGGASLPYPPTEADVREYAKAKGLKLDPWSFYMYYRERNWLQSNGKPLRAWGARMESWDSREWNHRTDQPANDPEEQARAAERNRAEMMALKKLLEGDDEP